MSTDATNNMTANGEALQTKATRRGEEVGGARLLTLAQVGERLQIGRVSCWRLHAERGLRVVRIGRAIRVCERDLEAWLEKHATAASPGGDGKAEVS